MKLVKNLMNAKGYCKTGLDALEPGKCKCSTLAPKKIVKIIFKITLHQNDVNFLDFYCNSHLVGTCTVQF